MSLNHELNIHEILFFLFFVMKRNVLKSENREIKYLPKKKKKNQIEKLSTSYLTLLRKPVWKLVISSLCPLFFIKFSFFHQMIALQKL